MYTINGLISHETQIILDWLSTGIETGPHGRSVSSDQKKESENIHEIDVPHQIRWYFISFLYVLRLKVK